MSVTNNDIRSFLSLSPSDKEFNIIQVDSLDVNYNTLMFINKPDINLERLDNSEHCVYLINESYPELQSKRNDFIRVKNPKFTFCLVVSKFELLSRLQRIHTDNLSKSDYLRYLPNIYCKEIIIGRNCWIDHGVILGGIDFSPVLGYDAETIVQFPQLGGVLIGNNVVIKYNTMVGRGTFNYTKIGDNTQIDFGCQIGHNCIIGKSCIIAAGTIIGGSTVIGDHTVIGIGAKIRNGIKIGKNVSIGMGAVVIRDIPDNSVVVGNPAHIIDHKKIFDEGGLI